VLRRSVRTLLVAGVFTVCASAGASGQDAAGSVEGTVRLDERPRRTANRYAGGAAAASQVQSVPAIAYIVGPVDGAPFPATAERPSMLQVDTAFVPSIVAVPLGGVVEFPNGDEFFHNVMSYSEAQNFDLGHYPMGESKSVAFGRAGEVKIYCEVHEFMRGAVLVTENPFYAVADSEGYFRIDSIPPGEYTLAIWHVELGRTEETILVTDGGTVQVEVELRQ
jgi:plastocyanin